MADGVTPTVSGARSAALDARALQYESSETVARRAGEMARWRRRSAQIRTWRRVLPAVMAALFALLVGWIGVRSAFGAFTRTGESGGIRMLHPRFFGRSSDGKAFRLNADAATRDFATPNRVALEQPRMSLGGAAPKPTTASAVAGVFHDDTHLLVLNGSVVLDDGQGNRFDAPAAQIDTKARTATGTGGIVGVGPLGRITASSYAVTGRGGHVSFSGGVHGHLIQQAAPADRRTGGGSGGLRGALAARAGEQ